MNKKAASERNAALWPLPRLRQRLEDIGVTSLTVGYRNPYEPDEWKLQDKIDWVKRFGDEVIAHY